MVTRVSISMRNDSRVCRLSTTYVYEDKCKMLHQSRVPPHLNGDVLGLTSLGDKGFSRLAIERARVRIPFATISQFGHFRSLHDASVDSAV